MSGRVVVSKEYKGLAVGANRFLVNSLGNANGNGVYIVTIRVNGKIEETHTVLRRTTH